MLLHSETVTVALANQQATHMCLILIFSTDFRKILKSRISWNSIQKGTRNAETQHNVPMANRLFRVANRVYARSDIESNTILTSHELPHCNNKPVAGSLSTSEHTTDTGRASTIIKWLVHPNKSDTPQVERRRPSPSRLVVRTYQHRQHETIKSISMFYFGKYCTIFHHLVLGGVN
jgi:hypothetical protein